MQGFSVRYSEMQTANNRTIIAVTISLLDWTPVSLLDIGMTHSRASGKQRESFELYKEPGNKLSTDGRGNLLLTFAVIFFPVEMHDSSYHVLI